MKLFDVLRRLFVRSVPKHKALEGYPESTNGKPPKIPIDAEQDDIERKQIKTNRQLIEAGHMEIIFTDGPHGGDYLEFHFFNDQGHYVTKDMCTKAVMRECNMDGELLYEEWAIINQGQHRDLH